jgi:OST-HTH/LOTUS domain
VEILAESKTGMSLAQLPLYLKRKLPFTLDLNELGFPKLKDLILSMSDRIKLELRGHNHPFAYLIKSGRFVHSSSHSDDF